MTQVDKFLSVRLEKLAARRCRDTAYRFLLSDHEEATLSYQQLWERSQTLAGQLRHVLPEGSRALLVFPPGLEFIVALFACLSARVVGVPLPFPRRDEVDTRLIHAYRDCEPVLILTQANAVDVLRASLPADVAACVASCADLQDHRLGPRAGAATSPITIALLQYTSGSTAAPKGVMLTHENLHANLEQIRIAFSHTVESVGVIWLPHYHDMGLIGGILQPLHVGFPVTLFAPGRFLQRPLRWLEAIDRFQATTSGGPCFAYDLCVEKATRNPDLQVRLNSWRVAFNGAEPVRFDSLIQFASTFAKHGFSRKAFTPCYGLAEATLLVSSAPYGQGATLLEGQPDISSRSLVSTGRAAVDIALSVTDVESGEPCAEGCIGEVCVSGPSVSPGYWADRHQITNAASRRLRTGDLGFLLDGELYITGRIKDLIIIRGKNLAAEDIEEVMREADPRLRHEGCAAISINGQHGEELVLLQEFNGRLAREISLDDVEDRVVESVIHRHGVLPTAYVPVKANTLARTSSGKISRFATKKLYVENKLARLGRAAATFSISSRHSCNPSS